MEQACVLVDVCLERRRDEGCLKTSNIAPHLGLSAPEFHMSRYKSNLESPRHTSSMDVLGALKVKDRSWKPAERDHFGT